MSALIQSFLLNEGYVLLVQSAVYVFSSSWMALHLSYQRGSSSGVTAGKVGGSFVSPVVFAVPLPKSRGKMSVGILQLKKWSIVVVLRIYLQEVYSKVELIKKKHNPIKNLNKRKSSTGPKNSNNLRGSFEDKKQKLFLFCSLTNIFHCLAKS